MKQIVICGAGFGGLNCAMKLSEYMPDAEIILVDQSPYHVLHAFLYEVATSDEEVTSMADMTRSVALPIKEIIKGTNITFRQAKVVSVDAETKTVELEQGKLSYDYLVLALGSTSNFYGIPGAAENSLPLKTLRDAFAIRNRIGFVTEAVRLAGRQRKLRFVVAGGGFAGVEVAAEMVGVLDFLAWKNNYPRELMEIMIVEGAPQVMPGLGDKVSRDTFARLDELGILVETKSLITNVTDTFLELNDGEKLNYDMLVWTAGVKAISVPMTPEPQMDRGGRVQTNGYFQINGQPNVFVIGDECCFLGTDGRPLPGTGTQATDHGKYVANAIAMFSQNKKPRPYECKDFGYAISVGGKWGIAITSKLYIKGYFVKLFMKFEWYKYLRPLIGRSNAFKIIWLQAKVYSRND